jgi:RimJ/RimL family protein N-acetyltransferase
LLRRILKNNTLLNIRAAEEQDALEIVEMFRLMGGESENLTYGYNDYYYNENQERMFIKTLKERNNTLFIVAVIDDKIIGYLSLSAMQRGRLSHRGDMGISVLKDYWGQGIGSALIEYLMDWAEKSGIIKKIDLQVRVDNDRAVKLYRRWGFKIEGIISRGMHIDDKYFDLYYMGKTIGR